MRAYAATGPLVRMITQILYDMVVFSVVVVVLSLGFLGAFALLLPGGEAFRGWNGLLTMVSTSRCGRDDPCSYYFCHYAFVFAYIYAFVYLPSLVRAPARRLRLGRV